MVVEFAIIASCLLSPIAMGLVSPIGTVRAEFPVPQQSEDGEEQPPKMVEDKVYYFRGY